jgi:beta-xylosidase
VDQGGAAYLYLSTGHKCPSPSPPNAVCPWDRTISLIPLSADLLEATGPRQQLFSSGASWENGVVEGPWMSRRDSSYELFYSGGVFTSAYGMGVATASSPTGPFTKSSLNPLIYDTADVKGPGGGSLVTGPRGSEWVAYHGRAGSYSQPRILRMDRVSATASGPEVEGPTTAPQPVP